MRYSNTLPIDSPAGGAVRMAGSIWVFFFKGSQFCSGYQAGRCQKTTTMTTTTTKYHFAVTRPASSSERLWVTVDGQPYLLIWGKRPLLYLVTKALCLCDHAIWQICLLWQQSQHGVTAKQGRAGLLDANPAHYSLLRGSHASASLLQVKVTTAFTSKRLQWGLCGLLFTGCLYMQSEAVPYLLQHRPAVSRCIDLTVH